RAEASTIRLRARTTWVWRDGASPRSEGVGPGNTPVRAGSMRNRALTVGGRGGRKETAAPAPAGTSRASIASHRQRRRRGGGSRGAGGVAVSIGDWDMAKSLGG